MFELRYPHLFEPIVLGGTVFRNRIFASPTGYQNVTCDDILPPGAEALCALAGPTANLLCAGLFLRILPEFAGVSLALGAFNLLPIFPLDGGRLLRLALRNTRAARTLELLVGLFCCAALLALGLWAARRLQTGLWVLLPALIPAARLLRSCDGI